jgi:hypothetical protein
MREKCAPIAIFVYRRPEHTRQLLLSLLANEAVYDSQVHVFCEGPQGEADSSAVHETRRIVRELTKGLAVTIEERTKNLGCSASIEAGIGEVLKRSDRIIVLEDDLRLSSHFLDYMNAALERFHGVESVMHVSGFMHSVDMSGFDTAQFFPFTNPWGWGTWRRAWRHYDRDFSGADWALRYWYRRFRMDVYGAFQLRKAVLLAQAQQITDWDTKWALTVFRRSGLSLFPRRSLVRNTGFDGSGSHEMEERLRPRSLDISSNREDVLPELIRWDRQALEHVAFVLSGNRNLVARTLAHARGRWGWRESIARLGGMRGLQRGGYLPGGGNSPSGLTE